MKVLLSIKPEFVDKIFSGEKKYEYRKQIFKKNIEKVIVYSTQPEGKIIGEFVIEEVLHDKVDIIWSLTKDFSGITYSKFYSYFNGRKEGYAIKIGKVKLYDQPVDPKEFDSKFKPPQSFCYVKENLFKDVKMS